MRSEKTGIFFSFSSALCFCEIIASETLSPVKPSPCANSKKKGYLLLQGTRVFSAEKGRKCNYRGVFFLFSVPGKAGTKCGAERNPFFPYSFYYIIRSPVAEQRANRVTSRRGMWPDAGIACAQPRCGRSLSLSAWQLSWCSRFFVRWLDLHQIVIARALSSVVVQS